MLPWPFGLSVGDAVVDRQRAEQRQQHEDERRERREGAGGEERDAGLVAERREVVDARQAHDLPPGGRMSRAGGRSARLDQPVIQPVVDVLFPRGGRRAPNHRAIVA